MTRIGVECEENTSQKRKRNDPLIEIASKGQSLHFRKETIKNLEERE